MKKIGITGSLASGKTTASKILSYNKGPLFSADKIVKSFYKKKYIQNIIRKKFKIKSKLNLKRVLRKEITKKESNILRLEKILHPLVRKEMANFSKKNIYKKFAFYEIPLLIESKLMNKFNIIIFIKAKKNIRLKRFLSKGGSRKIFEILDKKQFSDKKKETYSDHVIVNDKNKKILKKNLMDILAKYE
tara:strand:- start:1495 stop:2061 length:567 start_codon:yes stop_codon:yes gene_type:complete